MASNGAYSGQPWLPSPTLILTLPYRSRCSVLSAKPASCAWRSTEYTSTQKSAEELKCAPPCVPLCSLCALCGKAFLACSIPESSQNQSTVSLTRKLTDRRVRTAQ